MSDCPNITIKNTTRKDVIEFRDLESACFDEKNYNTQKDLTDTNHTPNHGSGLYYCTTILEHLPCLKAVDDATKKIVGGIIIVPSKKNSCVFIDSVFVDPQYRRHGIADMLLQRTIQITKKHYNNYSVALVVDPQKPKLYEFYKKYGFVKKEMYCNYYSHPNSDRIYMVLQTTNIHKHAQTNNRYSKPYKK